MGLPALLARGKVGRGGASAHLQHVVPGSVLPALVGADPSRRQWTISAGQVVLRLALRAPGDLTRAATLLGPSHQLAGQPLALHLLLVLLARGATVDAGTAAAAEVLARQLDQEQIVTETEADPPETDAAIHATVQAAITDADVLRFQARWNLARGLSELGCQLWQLRGQAARPFTLVERYNNCEALLSSTAALAVPLVASVLPLPLSQRSCPGGRGPGGVWCPHGRLV